MDGAEVFSFTQKIVPKLVSGVLADAGVQATDVHHVVFHQANEFMLRFLAKKIGLPPEKLVVGLAAIRQHDVAVDPAGDGDRARGRRCRRRRRRCSSRGSASDGRGAPPSSASGRSPRWDSRRCRHERAGTVSPAVPPSGLPGIDGRRFLVTGATSGIGLETTRLLVSLGASVAACGRQVERLEADVAAAGAGRIVPLVCDLEDPASGETVVKQAVEAMGPLDGFVHSGGVIDLRPLKVSGSADLSNVCIASTSKPACSSRRRSARRPHGATARASSS